FDPNNFDIISFVPNHLQNVKIMRSKYNYSGSIVPGSGLKNIQNRGFQTVNPEPANLSSYKEKYN
ncbi:hypothetical protein JW964_20135, partial [candidate division KSB1 bacterium]|nr:hypothetical protein [candidate division KSB1 bacterium]